MHVDQIFRHERARGKYSFSPVQLTTSRIGNLTRLMRTLAYNVCTIHVYNVGTIHVGYNVGTIHVDCNVYMLIIMCVPYMLIIMCVPYMIIMWVPYMLIIMCVPYMLIIMWVLGKEGVSPLIYLLCVAFVPNPSHLRT